MKKFLRSKKKTLSKQPTLASKLENPMDVKYKFIKGHGVKVRKRGRR